LNKYVLVFLTLILLVYDLDFFLFATFCMYMLYV